MDLIKWILPNYDFNQSRWTCSKTHTCSSVWDPLPISWDRMSTWGHLGPQWSKGHFQQKCYFCYRIHGNNYLYVMKCIYVTHKYALTWESLLLSLGQCQLWITSAGRVRHLWWQMCLVLLSSGNTFKTYSFDMPWPISIKLGHKNSWPMAFISYNQSGVKSHVGVTGVKKVKNSKTLLLLQITG